MWSSPWESVSEESSSTLEESSSNLTWDSAAFLDSQGFNLDLTADFSQGDTGLGAVEQGDQGLGHVEQGDLELEGVDQGLDDAESTKETQGFMNSLEKITHEDFMMQNDHDDKLSYKDHANPDLTSQNVVFVADKELHGSPLETVFDATETARPKR